MMLGEPSESADYWRKAGDEALAHNIKGVVMMVKTTHPVFVSKRRTGTSSQEDVSS